MKNKSKRKRRLKKSIKKRTRKIFLARTDKAFGNILKNRGVYNPDLLNEED